MPSQDDRAHDEERGATPTAERDAPVDAPFAKPADEVCSAVEVDPAQGLSDDEARRRLERYGPNELREARTKSPWRILLDQFMSTVILVLVAAGVVAVATARWEEAIAIAAVVLVNAGIGFTTEWRAVRAMNALRVLARPDVRVRRGGRERSVDESKLVPGDIVVLESGDRVPADLRLLEANGVRVDEASLTGESVAVTKRVDAVEADAPLAERTSMTYRGTLIGDGSGEGVVTATGMATELGRISELAESAEAQVTPLQRRLDHLGRRLAVLTIAIVSTARRLPRWSRRRCNGVTCASADSASSEMRPSSVAMPVAVTTPSPEPSPISVPRYVIGVRSANGASASTASIRFVTATDSPVRDASSTRTPFASSSRRSAGTRSPLSSTTMSPGTSSDSSTDRSRPPRRTRTSGRARTRKAFIARTARHSVVKPIPALTSTTAAMAIASSQRAVATATTPAATSTRITVLMNWSSRIRHGLLVRASRSSLGPCRSSRRRASSSLSPWAGSTSRAEQTSSAGLAKGVSTGASRSAVGVAPRCSS